MMFLTVVIPDADEETHQRVHAAVAAAGFDDFESYLQTEEQFRDTHAFKPPAPSRCRVYWGHSGCNLPRGHDADQPIRTHRQTEPSQQTATADTACLFGEDLTDAERRKIAEVWG